MALRGEIDDVGAGEEGEVGMFLHRGVITSRKIDGAVEVDESGVAVRFCIIEDALDAGLLYIVVDRHFV